MLQHKGFGFFAVLAMIVGICIGSGIFFKASSILEATGGNVALGVLIFLIGAISIVFGSLSLSEFALRSQKDGGLIGYFEQFIGPKIAGAFARFQAFIYLPTIAAVVAWVAGMYTLQLFQILIPEQWVLAAQVLIGAAYIVFFALMNMLSTKAGKAFQSLVTVVKLLPLAVIAFAGLFLGDSSAQTFQSLTSFSFSNLGWLAAIVPMAFAYDGWIVATTLGQEVRNPQKTMRLALVLGPLIILAIYVLYFLGIVGLLGVDAVLTEGKNAVYLAGNMIFGSRGGNLILTLVLISVLGVINGLVIGMIRVPQVLINKSMLGPLIRYFPPKQTSGLTRTSMRCAVFLMMLWLLVHYVVMRYDAFNGGDISEIAIVFSYLAYSVLYVRLMLFTEVKKWWVRWLFPSLAVLGSAIILFGSLMVTPRNVVIFLLICSVRSALGYRMQTVRFSSPK